MKSLANSENLLSVLFRYLIKNGDFNLKNAYRKPFMIWKLFRKTPLTSKFLRISPASNERCTQEKSPPMTEEVIIRSVSKNTFRISLYLNIAKQEADQKIIKPSARKWKYRYINLDCSQISFSCNCLFQRLSQNSETKNITRRGIYHISVVPCTNMHLCRL